MFEGWVGRVTGLGEALTGLLDGLDPDAMTTVTAEQGWAALDQLERLAAGGKLLLARRAAQAPPQTRGPGAAARTPAERLAARAGTGLGTAREALDTSHRLPNTPTVAAALRAGRLSTAQAAAVSAAAVADPAAEARLVELAQTVSLSEVRQECARVRAAADPDPAARNARLHAARRLRRFTDAEGAWQLLARGTPQAGAAFNAVLDPLIDRVFQTARRAGRHEPPDAYAFDALMAMADLAAGDTPTTLGTPTTPDTSSTGHRGEAGPGSSRADLPDRATPGDAPRQDHRVARRDAPVDDDRTADPDTAAPTGAPPVTGVGSGTAKEPAMGVAPDTGRGRLGSDPAGRPPEPPAPQAPTGPDTRGRLANLPWWAAAQGILLGGSPEADQPRNHLPGDDPNVDDRRVDPLGSRTAVPVRVDNRPTGRDDRRPSWWRLAHLLHPCPPDLYDPVPAMTDPPDALHSLGHSSADPGDTIHRLGHSSADPDNGTAATSEPLRRGGQAREAPTPGGQASPEDDAAPAPAQVSAAPLAAPPAAPRAAPMAAPPGGAPRRHPRHLALLRVDLAALHRGSLDPGETCEIAGVGPVPVDVARDLLGDSVLKLVITRGVDVVNVTHLGRGPTAAQRIALAWQTPRCSVAGCPRRRVEIDHRRDWAQTRHTRLDELDPLCPHHHDLKTRHSWALVRGSGPRPLVPPTDPRHPHQAAVQGSAALDQAALQRATTDQTALERAARDQAATERAAAKVAATNQARADDAPATLTGPEGESGTKSSGAPPREPRAARADARHARQARPPVHRRSGVTPPLFDDDFP